ncbi:MAG: hypothetical protein R3F62_29185 [Planctomycetota bacterium]
MSRVAWALVLAAAAACAEEPAAWTPTLQRDLLARAASSGALERVLGVRGFQDPERGEALLLRGERDGHTLRATFELRSVGAMREERLVLQSELSLETGAFTRLRFLLVRGKQRVSGTATVQGEALVGEVRQGDEAEPFERPWDPSAQPLSWVLAFLAPLKDPTLPALLRGRIYHGVEQALAPEPATLRFAAAELALEGALPGERVAKAGLDAEGRLAWIELGDGGRALPLPAAEVERLVAAQPVSLE